MLRIWMKTIEKSEIDQIDGQQPKLGVNRPNRALNGLIGCYLTTGVNEHPSWVLILMVPKRALFM
jgi:hypothetical protein